MISRIESWTYLPRALLFALIAVLLTLALASSDVFRRIDFVLSDTHGRWFAPTVSFEDVVVIDVDEESLTQLQPKLGTWPYDREIYALVTQWLKQSGVRAIAFDILFSEPRKGDDAFAAVLDERVVMAAAALPFTFERGGSYHAQLQKKSWGLAPKEFVYLRQAYAQSSRPLRPRFHSVRAAAAGHDSADQEPCSSSRSRQQTTGGHGLFRHHSS